MERFFGAARFACWGILDPTLGTPLHEHTPLLACCWITRFRALPSPARLQVYIHVDSIPVPQRFTVHLTGRFNTCTLAAASALCLPVSLLAPAGPPFFKWARTAGSRRQCCTSSSACRCGDWLDSRQFHFATSLCLALHVSTGATLISRKSDKPPCPFEVTCSRSADPRYYGDTNHAV